MKRSKKRNDWDFAYYTARMVFAAAKRDEKRGKVPISLEELTRMFVNMMNCGRNLERIESGRKAKRSRTKVAK